MFRSFPLYIIRSLFTVHSASVYVIEACRQLSSRSICSYSKAVYKPVWHIPLLSVQWINSWWCTEEMSETCRFSCQNKFVKLVHLVSCIIKKFLMMHSHMKLKYGTPCCIVCYQLFGGTFLLPWCMFLRNVSYCLCDWTVSQARRPKPKSSLVWKHKTP